jgi:glutamate 5-kinase
MDDFSKYSRIVIKLGSSILINPDNYQFRIEWFNTFVNDIKALVAKGHEVIIVASGSIASGCVELGKKKGEFALEDYQALAAYGQLFLSNKFHDHFNMEGLKIAQLLLTIDDYQVRRRFLNTKFTINRLLDFGIIPIINENDTVATDEIRFGDNDHLAAKIAVISDADLLIILSDVAGVYDKNPKIHDDANLISNIVNVDFAKFSFDKVGNIGTGGMKSKLKALIKASQSGVDSVLSSGLIDYPLSKITADNSSFCKAISDKITAKNKWLLHLKSSGDVVVDTGAKDALFEGSSLLAVGIKSLIGRFDKGDIVRIVDRDKSFLGQGIVNYSSEDLQKIIGAQNSEHSKLLQRPANNSVVHVDNLVVI